MRSREYAEARVEAISAFRLGRVKVDKVPPNRLATIRANCNRIVTRETPTHEYATRHLERSGLTDQPSRSALSFR